MEKNQPHYGCYFQDDKAYRKFLTEKRGKYEKHTKFIELQIAYVFKLFVEKAIGVEYVVGIPTLESAIEKEKWTFEEILDKKIAYDEDIDLLIAPKEKLMEKERAYLQIVRFTGDVKTSTDGLLEFLRHKKFNVANDKNIYLLVAIEKGLRLNYLELGEKLQRTGVPYGKIFILALMEPDHSLKYFCSEVFPEVKPAVIDFKTCTVKWRQENVL